MELLPFIFLNLGGGAFFRDILIKMQELQHLLFNCICLLFYEQSLYNILLNTQSEFK